MSSKYTWGLVSLYWIHHGKKSLETHGNLDHFIQARSCSFQDCSSILAHLVCAFCNGSLDQLPVGIGGDLTGHKHEAIGLDGLGVRTNGFSLT